MGPHPVSVTTRDKSNCVIPLLVFGNPRFPNPKSYSWSTSTPKPKPGRNEGPLTRNIPWFRHRRRAHAGFRVIKNIRLLYYAAYLLIAWVFFLHSRKRFSATLNLRRLTAHPTPRRSGLMSLWYTIKYYSILEYNTTYHHNTLMYYNKTAIIAAPQKTAEPQVQPIWNNLRHQPELKLRYPKPKLYPESPMPLN